MSTPLSGALAYCTNAQFIARYDSRVCAQLVSDDDTDATDLATNAVLTNILKEASGKVEAAALVGERDTPVELAELTGNMAQMLAGLVADLAIVALYRRRPDVQMPAMPQMEEAMALLDALSEGRKIFGFAEHADAGHLSHETEDIGDIMERNGAAWQAKRFFGRRAKWESGGPPVGS